MVPSVKRSLLTIEDEPSVRMTLAAYFEDSGYIVLEAANGFEGLEIFRSEHPDIVFCDLRMPGMDGLSVVAEIRDMSPETPVIVVSGTGNINDAVEAVRCGAWDYVSKPIQDLAELELVADRALERAGLLAENRIYREHLEELVQEKTEKLRESELKYRMLFENANDAILLLEGDRIVDCNQNAQVMFGVIREQLMGSSLPDFAHVVQPDGVSSSAFIEPILISAYTGESKSFEWQIRRPDSSLCPTEVSLNRCEFGGYTYLLAQVRDISSRKRYESQLIYQANYDVLTGLPNKNLLSERFRQFAAQHLHQKKRLALLLFDLDNFKNINDTLGHVFGDQLLMAVALRLTGIARQNDTVARLGGDEFVIISPDVSTIDNLTQLAEKVRQIFIEPISVWEHELFVTASIGVVVYPHDGENIDTLLQNADAAMYQAKKQGKNVYRFYTSEISRGIQERLHLETRLRRALERGEFQLQYQPQVDVQIRRVVGVEALLRWRPDNGVTLVNPFDFIPVLEDTGLIVPVGDWVFREACRQYMEWQAAGIEGVTLSINISVCQFQSAKLPDSIKGAISSSGIDPAMICLEITESMIMQDSVESSSMLNTLTGLGCRLSIDDFGTGYSSLSYLSRLPISELKIDRSFIKNVPNDANDAVIVNTIIDLAECLRMSVVAEGVETEEQLEFLVKNNCYCFQGFYFSKPISAADFPEFVRDAAERFFGMPDRCPEMLE